MRSKSGYVHQLAEIITRVKGTRFEQSENLNEWDLSTWQGQREKEINTIEFETFLKTPDKLFAGELLSSVQKRMCDFFYAVIEKHNNGKVVFVSHASPIAALLLAIENKPFSLLHSFAPRKGDIISILVEKDRRHVIRWLIDTRHTRQNQQCSGKGEPPGDIDR